MKILSTNIAEQRIVKWRGKNVKTGIYKFPVDEPLFLGKEEVKGDEVSDRKHHGGIYKACYLFSADYYPYWKQLYPDLDWQYGMFGENLTVSGMDDSEVLVGSTYKVGTATIQITIPREPCYKLGIKFGTQKILKQFVQYGFPGTYVSVLEEGFANVGDEFKLMEKLEDAISVRKFFNLLYSKEKNEEHIKFLLKGIDLPEKMRGKLKDYL